MLPLPSSLARADVPRISPLRHPADPNTGALTASYRTTLVYRWLIVMLITTACNIPMPGTDPLGPRDCECEMLDEWAAELPINHKGDTLGIDNVNTGERVHGFFVSGSRKEPTGFNREAIVEPLTNAGFSMRVDRDDEETWNAAFYPGSSQATSPWSIDFTQTQGDVGFQVQVTVDGTPWGLVTIEDLWDSYHSDRDAAIQAQQERQQQALDSLHLLEAAMNSIASDD